MFREEKRSIINENLKKIRKADSTHVPDLKMELLVKTVNDYKL